MSKKIDIWIIMSFSFLSFFSLLNLFGVNKVLFYNQIIFFFVGLIFFLVFQRIGLNFFKENNQLFYFLGIFLLFLINFFAPEIRGSKRWINLYFFNLQLSEVFKPFFIISLAKSLSDRKINLFNFFIYLSPFFLIFKQPDLGNALVYLILFFGLLFFSRVSLKFLKLIFLSAIFFIPLSWNFLADYQKNRIISFFDPQIDSQGISYNQLQSIITIGSGSFFGRGLGFGTQSKLSFLPESHTDFVYATFIEQFGFIGGLILFILYFLLIWRLLKIVIKNQNEPFLSLFFIGVIIFFICHIFINMGMNLGILPITGITLPILSYGGSSIVTVMMILGLTSKY